MTNLNVIFFTLLLTIAAISCKNNTHQHTDQTQDMTSPVETIELNDNAKWVINEEMKPFLTESETILNKYIEDGSTDYVTLAKQLKDKNSGLIKSCTMEGKSHDELHKWLHPHMELIESLQKAEDANSANSIISELKQSYETFNQYFQ